MKISQISDEVMEDFFDAILDNIPKTIEYLGDTENLWYAFKYIRNYDKRVQAYIQRKFDEDPDTTLDLLGEIIGKEYDEMWFRLARVYFADYDPLTSYRRDDMFARVEKESNLEKRNSKITTEDNAESHVSYHGFNSDNITGVPVSDANGQNISERSGTDAYNNTQNSRDKGESHARKTTGYDQSPTELFTKEFQARRTQLIDIIMQDIANYVTIAVY